MKKVIKTLFSPDCYKLVMLIFSFTVVCPLTSEQTTPWLKLFHLYAAAVIVFDLLGEKRILKNKGRTILFVFVLCYGVTMLCNPELLTVSHFSFFGYLFTDLLLVYSYGPGSPRWNHITSAVFIVLASLSSLIGIWMFYAKFYISVSGGTCIGMYSAHNRLTGLFGNPNMMAVICFAAICLAVIEYTQESGRRGKTFLLLSVCINFIGLLLTNSRTQLYSLVFLCALLAFFRVWRGEKSGKRLLQACAAGAVTAVICFFGFKWIYEGLLLFDVNYQYYLDVICDKSESVSGDFFLREGDTLLSGRSDLWKAGLQMFACKPLFGIGLSNYANTLTEIGLSSNALSSSLHCSYLEILVNFGLAGFMCTLVFGGVTLKNVLLFFRFGGKGICRLVGVLTAVIAAYLLGATMESYLLSVSYPPCLFFWFILSQLWALLEEDNRKARRFYPGVLCLLTEKYENKQHTAGNRVCFVNDSMGGGGAEQTLVNVANALCECGYDVSLLTLWSGEILEEELVPAVRLSTVDPFVMRFFKRVLYWVNRHCMPRRLYNWLFLDGRFDFTVAFQEGLTTRLVADTRINTGGRRYAWVHTDLKTQNWVLPYYKSLEEQKQNYRVFDRVFCVSDLARAAFIDLIGCEDKVATLYNLIDSDRVIRLGQEPCPLARPEGLLASAVGRLNDQKGFDRLVSVIARLRENGVDLTLWIMGEGAKRSELEEQIRELKLEKCVKLLGFQRNPYCYAAQADFFVMSSRVEGFGLVVAENLLLGKPVVSTDCAGVREQLGDDEYGIVTENDEDSLYEGVYRMATDAVLREHYAKKASEHSRGMTYDALLARLLENF